MPVEKEIIKRHGERERIQKKLRGSYTNKTTTILLRKYTVLRREGK